MITAEHFIKSLDLQKHPEGGYYREVYRSNELIKKEYLPDRFNGSRCFSTSIYFLLESSDFSAFHRIKSDEIWNFFSGSSITIYILDSSGNLKQIKLGSNINNNEHFQLTVLYGCWFAAKVNEPLSYSLVGCTVSPGFDFEDFEMGNRKELTEIYPQHKSIIEELTVK